MGFNLSWSMNPMLDPADSGKILRSFSKPTIGASVSKGSLESYYRSARDQSGLFAGKDGFDIYVEKNTDLKGGVLASDAEAEKNRLSTGTFSFSDLKNEADCSAIVGAAAAKAVGGNAGSGASAAASGTKWNYLAEYHTPVQIGISIKLGLLGHVGIVVKTDTGSYDSADYGRYGEDTEESIRGLASPIGQGTFITRWFYNPDEKYTFMINPEYIDPIKAVAAYNDQIKNNGYTQIPMERTAEFFPEVRLVEGNTEEVNEQNEHAKEINANTQYYRNGTSDYHLIAHNCVTTTIIPILQSISYDNLSREAKITVRQLRENLFNPRAIYTILSDDIYFFQGKGLLTNGAYGRVPSE